MRSAKGGKARSMFGGGRERREGEEKEKGSKSKLRGERMSFCQLVYVADFGW